MIRKSPLRRGTKPLKRSGLKRGKKRIRKDKPTTSKKADILLSKYIRERDGKCVRCGKLTGLTNSHFWSRIHSATRYDPDNCDALCWLPCHYTWEHEKQGEYRDFKLRQLGPKRYKALEARARSSVARSEAIARFLAEVIHRPEEDPLL